MKRGAYDGFGFGLNLMEMLFSDETFGVDFIDIFGARGAGGKPSIFGANFQSAQGSAIAGGMCEPFGDRFASEGFGGDVFGREVGELLFLFAAGRSIDSGVRGRAMAGG